MDDAAYLCTKQSTIICANLYDDPNVDRDSEDYSSLFFNHKTCKACFSQNMRDYQTTYRKTHADKAKLYAAKAKMKRLADIGDKQGRVKLTAEDKQIKKAIRVQRMSHVYALTKHLDNEDLVEILKELRERKARPPADLNV